MRVFIAVLLVLSCTAHAQVPRHISYQGVLADAQGNLVPDGNHELSLTLFDAATNGNALFTETQTVPVVNGIFNVIIGSVTVLPPSLSFDRAYFLGVRVNGGAELSPRTPLTAVPYALRADRANIAESAAVADRALIADRANAADRAGTADRADVADALAPSATGVVTSLNSQSGAITLQGGGGTTVTNSGGTFTISSTGAGGTGIQGVQSTDGSLLVANPNGPVANLGIATGAVKAGNIADGAVSAVTITDNAISNSKIAEGAVTAEKIAAAQVVKSLNGLRDHVSIVPGSNITITPNGNAITIASGAQALQSIKNDDNTIKVSNGGGPIATIGLEANGVGTMHLTDGSVTAGKLAPGVIPSVLPPSGAAGGALTGTYPNPALAANAVSSGHIVDGTISTVDIANDAVTITKIDDAGATNGQVITFNGSDVVWQSPSGLNGSGIANRLAFWSGSNALTSDANYTITPGNNTKIALGFQCTATGDNGVAIGAQCSASGSNTVAMGAGSIASANGAVAIGVTAVANGVRSHAIGNFVTAANNGAFVLGDANTTAFTSSASNQMNMRFVGGYRLFSNSAFSTGVTMAAGVSGWTNVCDRNLKENFSPVDGEWLLGRIRELPITEWSYIKSDPSIRYIGPMAQDFHAAFHLGGSDSLGINSIIADGVNLAAIKALEERTRILHETVRAQQRLIDQLLDEQRAHRVRRASYRKDS